MFLVFSEKTGVIELHNQMKRQQHDDVFINVQVKTIPIYIVNNKKLVIMFNKT